MPRKPQPRLRAGFARRTAARKRQGVSLLKETGAPGYARKETNKRASAVQRKYAALGRRSPGASNQGLPGKPTKPARDRSLTKKTRATNVAKRNKGMR